VLQYGFGRNRRTNGSIRQSDAFRDSASQDGNTDPKLNIDPAGMVNPLASLPSFVTKSIVVLGP
jgi:hypothetical protein